MGTAHERSFIEAALNVQINEPAVNRTVRDIRYKASTLEGINRSAWLLKAISFIDLTTLSGNDTASNVHTLCKKAVHVFPNTDKWLSSLHTAAVCVYPSRIADAKEALNKYDKCSELKIASVAGGFPSGQYPLDTRIEEIEFAIEKGANEIDIVIDRSLVLNHKWQKLYREIKACKKACGKEVHLKTILSTGELFNLKDVYKASMVAMMAGSDFIKTSTGKETVNATLPVGVVMCRAIKDYYKLTKIMVGFKPAGGIASAQDALEWMVLVQTELGSKYLTKEKFRIGASSLLDKVVTEFHKCYNISS